MKITGVNGAIYSSDVDDDLLRHALQDGKTSTQPLQLLVQSGEFYKVYGFPYHGASVPAPCPRPVHAGFVNSDHRAARGKADELRAFGTLPASRREERDSFPSFPKEGLGGIRTLRLLLSLKEAGGFNGFRATMKQKSKNAEFIKTRSVHGRHRRSLPQVPCAGVVSVSVRRRAATPGLRATLFIFVEFDPQARIGFLTLAALTQELSELLRKPVDVVPEGRIKRNGSARKSSRRRRLSMRRDLLYLRDILEAADSISQFLDGVTEESSTPAI